MGCNAYTGHTVNNIVTILYVSGMVTLLTMVIISEYIKIESLCYMPLANIICMLIITQLYRFICVYICMCMCIYTLECMRKIHILELMRRKSKLDFFVDLQQYCYFHCLFMHV